MRFTVHSDEPATQEDVLPSPDGTLAAEAHSISGPLDVRTWRPADPATVVRARTTRPALLGPA
ncbi:hypothetical protein [Streptomyces sp. NRRL B-1347]|uniref:hypothetical protein n=1 Tax=Streptomyces sp. NRRL B-1347 TaxID=1476877 RepID=UPI0004C90343|nr:hypothetical protein [Streptomyces sp. NRRL B-1347]